MLNKNVANYTDFDGKTNKKIVQAPGGSSSLSFAWSNQPVDYGMPRNLKKKNNQPISENSKVITPNRHEKQSYLNQKNNYNNLGGQIGQIGGQYGYNQYNINKYENQKNLNSNQNQINPTIPQYKLQPETIDLAVYQQNKTQKQSKRKPSEQNVFTMQKPPQNIMMKQPKNNNLSKPPQQHQQTQKYIQAVQSRACIKMNNKPQQSLIIGDSYNYWKDDLKRNNRDQNHNEQYSANSSRQNMNYSQKLSMKNKNQPIKNLFQLN